jgi:hypothetical protein
LAEWQRARFIVTADCVRVHIERTEMPDLARL